MALSYTDKFAWGLRINPTFDELLKSTKKPIRIPQPDRSAKWFALSNYRSFMLDQAKKYNDQEHLRLDYEDSGAALPMTAARAHPSDAGNDEAWARQERFNAAVEEQDAYDLAFAAMEAEHRQQASDIRARQLASYAPSQGHWFISANHDDLEDAGVEHDAPLPRPQMTRGSWPAALESTAAAGHVGGSSFPTYEQINYGQPRRFRTAAHPVATRGSSYEQLRNLALGR